MFILKTWLLSDVIYLIFVIIMPQIQLGEIIKILSLSTAQSEKEKHFKIQIIWILIQPLPLLCLCNFHHNNGKSLWGSGNICVCACVWSQMTTKPNRELQKRKRFTAKPLAFQRDESHRNIKYRSISWMNIARPVFVCLFPSSCMHTCFLPCKHDSDYLCIQHPQVSI